MKTVRVIAIVALAFLAVSAIAGAVLLIQAPSGSPPLSIPLGVLEHTPFHSFLVPGILLLVANGLLGLVVLAIAIFCKHGYGPWITFQGCVLFGWITIEVLLLRTVAWPHFLYWGLALVLIAAGGYLAREPQPPRGHGRSTQMAQ